MPDKGIRRKTLTVLVILIILAAGSLPSVAIGHPLAQEPAPTPTTSDDPPQDDERTQETDPPDSEDEANEEQQEQEDRFLPPLPPPPGSEPADEETDEDEPGDPEPSEDTDSTDEPAEEEADEDQDDADSPDDDTTVSRTPNCNAAAPIENPPRFMTLPFPADTQMEVFHGWRYTFNNQPQCGIDYGKRDNNNQLASFPVLAVADGEACADWDDTAGGCVSGYGGRVLVRHRVEGKIYYTYYGHMEWIDPEIPIGNRSDTIRVRRGQLLGYAGDTGTQEGVIHLHFGIASPEFGWYDPYDIWTRAVNYPDPNGINGLSAGSNSFWTTSPPSSTERSGLIGGSEASVPADTLGTGVINLSEWTQVMGRQSGIIEIWINGELRGEAPYGPERDGDNSSFIWEWDTTRERNGPHRVRLVAYSEDSSETPLLTATEAQEASFLIAIQNPRGMVETPTTQETVSGTIDISGWAVAEESEIGEVEIWINGKKRGSAVYGLPHRGAGGDYGFRWEWDTTREQEGTYQVYVRALAENNGSKQLPLAHNTREDTILVTVKNSNYISKWSIR